MRTRSPQTAEPSRTPARAARRALRLLPLPYSLLTALLLVLPGCGYSTAELYPERYTTVSLPLFENQTFYRGVEAELGEALAKELEHRTPYTLSTPGMADTELTGTVTRVSQRMLSRTADVGLPQELEVSVWVDFEWKDLRTGEVITGRRGYEQVGRYIPAAGVGEPFEVAQRAAVQRLARDIVSSLRKEW